MPSYTICGMCGSEIEVGYPCPTCSKHKEIAKDKEAEGQKGKSGESKDREKK